MVQLMRSLHFEKVEDFTEEEYGPLAKRSRSSVCPINQQWKHDFPIPPSQYNPLDEPSPLGLRLKKSPSLLELIQMRISQGNNASNTMGPTVVVKSETKSDVKEIAANDKLKASNFPAALLRIGTWEYVSKYEGDLVAKSYFAKHKLVWEVLEGGLKSKIEIQWSDITAIKAECPENGLGILTIVLARRPIFFRETNPQPRKHTLWQAAPDFTDGQATLNRQHYLEFPPGVLNKHYEKLIQCDTRLHILSRQPEIVLGSPYFESQIIENSEEFKSDGSNHDVSSALSSSSSSSSKDAPSPISFSEGNKIINGHNSKGPQIQEPASGSGIRPSMSKSDLVDHLGNYISNQMTSLPSEKASECHTMLESIAQDLLDDITQHPMMLLDEKSLMKKVESLCNLLDGPNDHGGNDFFDLANGSVQENGVNNMEGPDGNLNQTKLPRNDSFGDFLLHLPRIASLPKLLVGIAEDDEFQGI